MLEAGKYKIEDIDQFIKLDVSKYIFGFEYDFCWSDMENIQQFYEAEQRADNNTLIDLINQALDAEKDDADNIELKAIKVIDYIPSADSVIVRYNTVKAMTLKEFINWYETTCFDPNGIRNVLIEIVKVCNE